MWTRRMVLMLPTGLALMAERLMAQQKPAPPTPAPLPTNLPVPKDDGGAKHLTGMAVPAIPLMSTSKRMVDISKPTRARTVVYFYPMTGRPGVTMPAGWDEIPGARGCTLETCGFRDLHAELAKLNADVYGVSVQSTAYQKEMVDRLKVPFEVLSDEQMALTKAMKLPLFTAGGMTLNKRLTLVIRGGKVEHVFYPVFPPDKHADEVIAWLKAH